MHVYGDRRAHSWSLRRCHVVPVGQKRRRRDVLCLTAGGLHSLSSSQHTLCLSQKRVVNTARGAAAEGKRKSLLPLPDNPLDWGSDVLNGCNSP